MFSPVHQSAHLCEKADGAPRCTVGLYWGSLDGAAVIMLDRRWIMTNSFLQIEKFSLSFTCCSTLCAIFWILFSDEVKFHFLSLTGDFQKKIKILDGKSCNRSQCSSVQQSPGYKDGHVESKSAVADISKNGAETLLRTRQLCSHSRTSQHFMKPEGSLPCSQQPSTAPYSEPDRSSQYLPILSLWSISILSTHVRLGLPSGLFLSGFPTNILYAFPFAPIL
jgi:hypothetical protein